MECLEVGNGEGCWRWRGPYWGRYGRVRIDGNVFAYAHRFSWERENGPIPDGMCVLHKCDHPWCVNPDHLYVGTQKDNARDVRVRLGRVASHGDSHRMSKLSSRVVRRCRQRFSRGETIAAMAKEAGVCWHTMAYAIHGRSWKHTSGAVPWSVGGASARLQVYLDSR